MCTFSDACDESLMELSNNAYDELLRVNSSDACDESLLARLAMFMMSRPILDKKNKKS